VSYKYRWKSSWWYCRPCISHKIPPDGWRNESFAI